MINSARSLCKLKNLHDKNNDNLWVVGSISNNDIRIFSGNNTDAEVKKGYSKETETNYFDVRATRLKRFIKNTPNWANIIIR